MRAVWIAEHGPPGVLEMREVESPEPGPGEARVEVEATALNRADLLQRAGGYPAPPGAPDRIPGLEFAGVVAEVGEEIHDGPAPGDRVMGLLGGGGYAEEVVTPAGMLLPLPRGLDFVQAAAIPEVFFTAYDALLRQAELGVGEGVLIHAAGGGVGTAALQLARLAGAHPIIGTASGPKLEGIAEAGLPLDVPVNYREASFREAVREHTGGRGVDVVLDVVGGDYWADNVASLAELGRMVLVGLLGGARVEVDLGVLLRRRLRVLGTVLRSRSLAEKLALTRQVGERLVPLFASGRLRPVVDRTFPLEEAADAHRYMAENRNLGKIVLEVG